MHSVFSGGNVTVKQIADYSRQNNLVLGIADQYSWHKYKKSKLPRHTNHYLQDINDAKGSTGNILCGIEIDTTSIHRYTFFEQFTDTLDFALFEYVLDLAGNYSYDPKRRNRTMDHLTEIARFKKETDLFVGLSRPDVSLVIDQSLLQESLDFIEKTGIAMELNEKHGNYYTPTFLREVLKRDIPLFCGTSARELDDIGNFPFISQFISHFDGVRKKISSFESRQQVTKGRKHSLEHRKREH